LSRNKITALLLVLALVLSLSFGIGCTPQKKPAPVPEDSRDNMTDRDDRTNITDNETTRKAARIAQTIADKNPSVNSATVVLANETVYVGIDLEADVTGSKAEAVKREVAKMVKQVEPDVNTVYVTEDADTYTRLQKIARDIENGRPVSGFLDEIQNMFKRITPSMK